MKNILFIIAFVLCGASVGHAAPASYFDYRDGNRYLCQMDEEVQAKTCVSNCRVRNSNGDCIQYNSDFCGDNVSCTPNCRTRNANGDCIQYNEDSCS